ncbi:hypothetical protein LIER_20474 [Lithospermum erythrorhizon]|uniref:Uncharacterized protein n=1 Tax=Lithospermum erythrorhizon TaxID=34254 RepID=A0AAV3QN09_LITER
MEEQRKRKRREGQNREGKKKDIASPEEQAAPPSEEEVEEFFAILRNMQVAVKYFEKSGGNIENLLKGQDDEKIREIDGDVKIEGNENWENRGGGLQLDLNAVPEDSV